MMTVHLRCGSYLLAPVTIDPSRTNTTASSRFPSQMTRLLSIATRLQTRLQAPRGPIWITGDTRSRRTRAMEQKKRDEAVQETKGIKRRSRSEPCRPPHTHSPRPALIRRVQRGRRNNRQKSQKTKSARRAHPIAPTLTNPVAVPRREVIEAGT